jgi:hypothetical protein
MPLDPEHHVVEPGDRFALPFPVWLQHGNYSGQGRAVQSDCSPSWNPAEFFQAVVAGFHPLTGHLQVLTGVVVDVTLPISEIHNVVGRTLLFVGVSPEQQVTRQA